MLTLIHHRLCHTYLFLYKFFLFENNVNINFKGYLL